MRLLLILALLRIHALARVATAGKALNAIRAIRSSAQRWIAVRAADSEIILLVRCRQQQRRQLQPRSFRQLLQQHRRQQQ
jgi:hypothetical protein